MLSEQQIAVFHSRGFLNGGEVLDDETVDILRSEIMCVIEEENREGTPQAVLNHNLSGKNETPVRQIVNIWEASQPLKNLVPHKQMVKAIAQLTRASELRIWHDQIPLVYPQASEITK